MRKITFILVLLSGCFVFGQNQEKIDSFLLEINRPQKTKNKLKLYENIINEYLNQKIINENELIKYINILKKNATNIDNVEFLAISYKLKGNFMARKIKNDSAIFFYKKGVKILDGNLSFKVGGDLFLNIGNLKYYKSEVDSTNFYYQKAIEIYEKTKNFRGLCYLSYSLAAINLKQNNFNNVSHNLEKLFVYNSTYKSDWFEAQGNYLLGVFYDEVQNKEEGKKYLEKAITILKNSKIKDYRNTRSLVNTLSSLGESLTIENNYRQAEKYCKEALDIHKKNKLKENPETISLIENLIRTLIKNQKINEAKKNIKFAYNLSNRLNHHYFKPFLMIDEAEVMIIENNLFNADKILNNVLKNNYETDSKTNLNLRLFEVFKTLYIKKNDYKNAYNFQNKFNVLKDSIFNTKLITNLNYTKEKFETQQKENKILQLNNQNLTKDIEIKKQNNLIIGVLSLFTISLSAFFFIWYKRKQKHKQLLLKTAIEASEQEKIAIGKDLHDGVASSIIKLVHQIEDTNIDVSHQLLKTYHQVRNLSHQLNNTPLHNELLLERLIEIIPDERNNQIFELQIKPSSLKLNEPIGTHIYRVIQELITNNLKYAKASKTKLSISLKNKTLMLSYKDNGIGIAKLQKKTGLKNIEDRVHLLNGTINWYTKPNNGFAVEIQIPYEG